MRSFTDAKAMARALRTGLQTRGINLTHAETLELVASQFGFDNWNILAAKIQLAEGGAAENGPEPRFIETCPILRIFDEDKAKEFYLDFLGFRLDWEHRFGDNFPLYFQASRAGLTLHLSGHHGDASPGATVFVAMTGVRAFHAELAAKDHRHMKPALETLDWGLQTTVTDPFGNRIRFCERND